MPVADPARIGQTLPLRDLHLPAPPGWWPPASGWWILAGLLVAAGLLLLLFWRRSRRLRYRRQALRRLAGLEQANELAAISLLAELSALLRRAALCAYPDGSCAGLNGEDWLRFLDRPLKESSFSQGVGRCLATGPYRKTADFDRAALLALCRRYLRRLPPTPRLRRTP